MATQNQINANRLNAQKSTGPTTQAGKAVSRLNAIKSGIDSKAICVFDEDLAEHEALVDDFNRQFQPLGIEERHWVDMLIHDEWLLRRYRMIHANLQSHAIKGALGSRSGSELGAGYAQEVNAFHRLHRHYNDTDRAYTRHLADLKLCQAERRQHEAEVDTPVTDSPQTENPEIGFVSQPAPSPAPEAAPHTAETPLSATSITQFRAPEVREGLPAPQTPPLPAPAKPKNVPRHKPNDEKR